MEGNLFILNLKKLPKAFTVFLLLLMLAETISSAIIKKLPSRHCLQRVLNVIERDQINADILILGDSFALSAFYSKDKVFSSSDKLMSGTVSLATNADVTMAGQYFVLRRYLARNKPPKMVFLISTPSLWEKRIGKFSDNYFFSCFNNTQEIKDILSFTRSSNFLVRMLYYKFLPSAQCSLYLAEFQGKSQDTRRMMVGYLKSVILMKLGLKPKSSLDEELSEISKPQFNVVGPLASERSRIFDDFKSRLLSSKQSQSQSMDFNMYYFDRICRMLKWKGIKLCYIDASTASSVFKQCGAYFSLSMDSIRALQRKRNDFLYLEDFTPPYIEDKYFSDLTHLNYSGAQYYLRIFNKSLERLVLIPEYGLSGYLPMTQ